MLIKHFRKTWKQPELSFFAFCKEFRIQFISLTILENYSLFANQTKKNMRLKNWTALSPETNMLYFCQFLNIPISDQDFAFLFLIWKWLDSLWREKLRTYLIIFGKWVGFNYIFARLLLHTNFYEKENEAKLLFPICLRVNNSTKFLRQ